MRGLGLSRRRLSLIAFLALVVGVGLLLVLPGRSVADAISNIAPASPVAASGWLGRYPVGRYQIDEFFPAVSVSLVGGVDVSGVVPMIAYAAAQIIWLITAFISSTLITVFGFAFNLNLLAGEGAVGGGALPPVAQAIHSIYTSTFGQPWLIAAVSAVAVWAMWKALVQRAYTQTATSLLTSLAFVIVALGLVMAPAQTITPLSRISNQVSRELLSLTSNGSLSEGDTAASQSSGQLFRTLVVDPWSVLEFGGIDHCVNTTNQSIPVQPLSPRLAQQLEAGSEVQAPGKRCIDNRNKYAPHLLAYPFGSPGRTAEYQAIKAGQDAKLPASDPAKSGGSYPLGPADKPAAEAAGKGGQYERLLLAILIFAAELGIWLLLGALAAGVILAQILLLLLLAFAPVVLVAAVLPGPGHRLFVGWASRMLGYLARKAFYSLILAVLLTVCQALQGASSSLGWLMSFLLQAVFCWTVLIQRHHLTNGLLPPASSSEGGLGRRLQAIYDATRLTQIATTRRHHTPPAASQVKPPSGAREDGNAAGAGSGGTSSGSAGPALTTSTQAPSVDGID